MASTRNLAIMAFTKGKKAGELAEEVSSELDATSLELEATNLISIEHQQAIDEQAIALANLEIDLNTLNNTTLPALESDLNELNNTTLPQLQDDLATIEGRTDVLTAGHILANIASAGEVRAEHIAADTITANKIAAGAITSSELATGAVTATKVSSDILTTNAINAGYMTIDKIYSGQKALDDGALFQLGDGTMYVGGITYHASVLAATDTTSSNTAALIGYAPVSGVGVAGGSVDYHGVIGTSVNGWGVYGLSTNGNAVYGKTSSASGSGVGGESSTGVKGYIGHSSYGLYTTGNAIIGGTTYPFTGAHKSYMQNTTNLMIGDIVESIDAWCVNINQTLVHTKRTDTSICKKVFGIVTEIADDIGNAFENDLYANQQEDGTWIVKDEYKPYIDYLVDNDFKEVGANALGEGGMNVCEIGGDILNGDYITSSTVAGKGQKQADDLLHNYTVAKALEDVIWADETIGEGYCFEQDGYKCKRIAVTYHCA